MVLAKSAVAEILLMPFAEFQSRDFPDKQIPLIQGEMYPQNQNFVSNFWVP